MKRREFNKSLAAVTAVTLSPFARSPVARAATAGRAASAAGVTPVIDYSGGFAGSSGAINVAGDGALSGSIIRLNNNPGHHSSCAFFRTQQPPTPFTTQFTFRPSELGSGPDQSGFTFCIQNTVTPPAAEGYAGIWYYGDANACGYGGLIGQNPPFDSMAIKFDASSVTGTPYPKGGQPSSTGMYFNNGPAGPNGGGVGLVPFLDLNPSGINFYNVHVFQVTIVYDGSLLTMVILDTTTNAQARFTWPLNLANTTNANGNYVGFTSGTAATGLFELLTWTYGSGYNTRVATPTFNPPPGQYSSPQTVTIAAPSGSNCFYTINGVAPTSSSTPYTGPITVSANEVIQAVAIQSGYTDSLVATALYQINTANVINFPSGFSGGGLINVGYAYLSGSAYVLTDATIYLSGAVWFPAAVSISSFSTTFTLQWTGNGQGMCFVIQNSPPPYPSPSTALNWMGGPTVIGICANGMGYGGMNANGGGNGGNGEAYGIMNSVAIAFNQYPIGSDPSNGVGLYTNGANPYGSQVATGLTFGSGHAISVALAYSGNTLSLTMTDTVTGAKFSRNFTVNIASTVGASTAYVGFTGSTGGATSVQSIQSWTYTASPGQAAAVPAAPTNLRVQ